MGELVQDPSSFLALRVEKLADKFMMIPTRRDRRLFTEFLVHGYQVTTLSSVPYNYLDDVIYAKVCLGMLITLYDDLADIPERYNPKLLAQLYKLRVTSSDSFSRVELTPCDYVIYNLACELFSELRSTLHLLPLSSEYLDILDFDIQHIFLANRYSELLTANPSMRNLTESKALGPYNMGMVAAGMIDLMGSPLFEPSRLGGIREILVHGQRAGRIGNLISTFDREVEEGDVTNEMLIPTMGPEAYKQKLLQEIQTIVHDLSVFNSPGINLATYVNGLMSLYQLHTKMEGII